uniref:Dipeptidyl peptidase like 10 n=1 Tax=Rousettus aegyptiacus TaxID=9407 RepID=A0A7J8JE38_ROUAE|nr:dipeptidyl peptidase like 10 [Rousettus aegyptiacus]
MNQTASVSHHIKCQPSKTIKVGPRFSLFPLFCTHIFIHLLNIWTLVSQGTDSGDTHLV